MVPKKKINSRALKKKKMTFGPQFWICATSETEKPPNNDSGTGVGVMPKLCNDCPLRFNAHIHPKATSYCSSYTVTPHCFLHKDGEKQTRRKKQSKRRNKFRSSDLAKWKRKCASAHHDSILGRLWWGGAQPDPRLLAQRKHNFVASLLRRPDAERWDNVYYISEWKLTFFLPNTKTIIT